MVILCSLCVVRVCMFDDRVLICFVGIILSALTQYFDIVSPGPGPVKGSHTSDTGVTTLVLVRGRGEGVCYKVSGI